MSHRSAGCGGPSEIAQTVADDARGAANTIRARLDGVEIHAANAYRPHQFLSPTTNRRTDAYGGSLENRLRFLREVTEAVVAQVGVGRLGVRISPCAAYCRLVRRQR